MGALFLASKLEENMTPPRNAVSVFYHILQPNEPTLEVTKCYLLILSIQLFNLFL